ncbi:hypothetical protein [Mesorhizobium australicum]|jgi:IS5 family transposase|uniref:Transposase, IS5 family n=1 Tax=Mesorhizobium australicum TaxID=536018 RepID=A0A1X7MR71_9HYPH|nr:hypothetical protein [Mesorhizobium australicum]SMH26828.1 transposase, IS5 family [Mesorhizobium australicum]
MIGPRSGGSADFRQSEPTPERTAFVRFRKALVMHGPDRSLFHAIIALASGEDGDTYWVSHKGKPTVHCFKAHVGADADVGTALVEELAIPAANVNDGKAGPDALSDCGFRSYPAGYSDLKPATIPINLGPLSY